MSRERFIILAGVVAEIPVLFSAAWVFGAEPLRSDLNLEDLERVRTVTAVTSDFTKAEPFERMSAGAATSLATVDVNAFSHFSPNLSFEDEQDFKLGNALFRKVWVSSPSSTRASDGLGPLFNARSCQRCHIKDGRGHPHEENSKLTADPLVIRLTVKALTEEQSASISTGNAMRIHEPVYGGQIQGSAVPGLVGEASVTVTYKEEEIILNGGETVSLRHPIYALSDLGYGPIDPDVMLSPRIAPPMIGLGLLEAIHPDDLLAKADQEDADGDGISGEPGWVKDPVTQTRMLGRFGWKASKPTVLAQSSEALTTDIGVSNPFFTNAYGDCTAFQTTCLSMPNGIQNRLGDTEAPDPVLDLIAFYASNLAVPARRNVSERDVLRGKKVFYEAGCDDCHTPKFVTSRDTARPQHRFQLIWPYTDLLLHDMGNGLADHQNVGDANGREWRTSPLWGIGLTEAVNGHTYFLHDGRARNLLEAIIWHGGEATESRDKIIDLEPIDRKALVKFLESL